MERKPENLGAEINTERRETFPFIAMKIELYFAVETMKFLSFTK